MSKNAVKRLMKKDNKNYNSIDLDPEKPLLTQKAKEPDEDDEDFMDEDDEPPLKEDPDYQKYFKMLKMGLPIGAVKNALVRDGKDPSIMDLDPNKSIKSQLKKDEDDGSPLKEDPDYEK